jgi:hypothetical protein
MAVATTVAVASVIWASPVVAASGFGLPEWACAPNSTARQKPDANRAGNTGKLHEPDLGQSAKALPARAVGRATDTFSAVVDVYFHVITNGTEGSVSNRAIDAQIAVLNKTFGGREGGSATGFSFRLAGVTRTNNAKWYAAKPGAEHEFKKTLKRGNDGDLNVYSTSGYIYLGWAYYPDITEGNQTYLDGIVIDWRSMPNVSDAYEDAYDEGETLTHEAGHWLNLAHTFENGCKEPGDFVADTPLQASPTSGCPIGRDSCTAPGLDPIHNYMDYSFDDCYTEFTDGQTQRMRDAWLLYRAS